MIKLKRITDGRRFRSQAGLGLVETLVAVAILGTSVVAFAVALSTGSIAVAEQDAAAVAQELAQNQLEYAKGQPYDTTYPAIDAPSGYAVSLSVAAVPGTDADLQQITVTVSREGQPVLTVADYKVNR